MATIPPRGQTAGDFFKTMKQQRLFKVRDLRQKEKFVVDDIYLNGYAKVFGPVVSAIYISLCRHANKEQEAWPSEEKLAEEWSMSSRTARRAIKILKHSRLIDIEKVRVSDGKWMNNIYILLDKSEWIKPEDTGVLRSARGQTEQKPEDTGVPLRKHIQKETHTISNASVAVNKTIELFKNINPSYEKLFKNKTQRSALERLLKKYGEIKVKGMLEFAAIIQSEKYAPTITTPLQLEDKLGSLLSYYKKKKSEVPLIMKV